jgi:uncharacterized membrane protein
MEISPKRLVIALALVFFLGILFSIVNGIYVQEEGTTLPLIIYGMSFISILLGGALVIMFQWRINTGLLKKVLKILPREERIVINLLIENKNTLEQNRLVALSGFNKVKISRILQVLQERDVIKKTNMGNTNLIVLKL